MIERLMTGSHDMTVAPHLAKQFLDGVVDDIPRHPWKQSQVREKVSVSDVLVQTGLVAHRRVESTKVLKQLQNLIPACLDILRFAQKETAALSSFMTTLFDSLATKAPALFNSLGSVYLYVWIAYYA